MKTNLIPKAAVCATALVSAASLWGSVLSSESYAQAVQPNTVFGCTVPGPGNREDPFGTGTQLANALIATPASTLVPVEANLAYFSTVGTYSGQARCLLVRGRLTTLNDPASFANLQGYVFGVGTAAGEPIICFRPPDGTCAMVLDPLQQAQPLPALTPFQGYLVMTLFYGDTSPAEALARLNTNLRSFSINAPATPNIDDSNVN